MSETSCTAISGRAPGLTSRSSVLRSTWLRVSKPSPNNWAERCRCPARSPTSSKVISISNASANIRCAASTTQSSCLRITAECRSIVRCRAAPKGREFVKRSLRMSVSVVAGPRFEPANLSRTESGEERLALHKNHEGRAQAVAAMRGYGTTAHGAKRPFQTSAASDAGVLRDRNDLELLTGCTCYIPNIFAHQKPCHWGYEGN